MNSTPASHPPTHWLDLVAWSGEVGEAWVRAYRAHPDLEHLGTTVLTALRRRDIEDGAAKLQLLHTIWERERPEATPSIQGVMDRWFYGVEGYYHYVVEEYSRASELMSKTNDAVIAAVSLERALLPLVHQCHEFALHQARIARNQGRWKKMAEIVSEVRAMMRDEVPLCRLHDGTKIFYRDLADHLRALPGNDSDLVEQEFAGLLNADLRVQYLERFLRGLYRIPEA